MMEAKDAAQQLRKVTELRSHIESTLLFGPDVGVNQSSIFDIDISDATLTDESDRRAFFQATKDEIVHLQQRTQQAVAPIFQGIRDRCVEVEDRLLQLQAAQDNSEVVMSKFAVYVRTEYKIQLLTMVKLLKQLEKATNILEIPSIVIQIATTSKMTVLEKSRMYAVLTDTVRAKKLKLLQKFHTLFEEHLDAEISTSTSASASASASASSSEQETEGQGDVYETQKNVWRQFLERSRQWLLSYALVSILPSIVIRSHRMVVERFKEALDEAMTPLWGRFYHHLKMGRESYSRNQILWTFKYAASFIEMLHHLCAHITAADEMRLIMVPAAAAVSVAADAASSSSSSSASSMNQAAVDFRAVAKAQVLEKALKFLNAHLASVFVLVSPWEDVFGMQLVDQLLEFDTWLASYEPPSYLCHILFESKVFFHQWLLLEQSLMHRRFDPTLPLTAGSTPTRHEPPPPGPPLEPDEAFAKKFSTTLNDVTAPHRPSSSSSSSASSASVSMTHRSTTGGGDRFVSIDKTTQLQCYAVLYDVLHYFLAARQRYAYFPPAAQYLLSELILEPLLCLLLGLCLYKIRCDPLLYAVSMGQASSSALVTFLREHITATHTETPEALRLFKDSVAYVQTALSVIDDHDNDNDDEEARAVLPPLIANDQRCKKRWTIVQEWLPKLLLTSDLRQQGYALRHLVKTAMKVSDKYRQHQHYAYRHQWTEHVQQQHQQHQHQHQHQHVSAASVTATTTLDACVTMTRGLVITMADVLDEQWQTLLAKHLSVLATTATTAAAATAATTATVATATTPPTTPAKPTAIKATI